MEDKRLPPMTGYEREVLIELVRKYKDLVENKRTDGTSVKLKNEAWDRISIEFCATLNTTVRNGKQLKKCWNNMKFKARQLKSNERKERMATVGGPSPEEDPNDSFLSLVESVAPQINMSMASEYDTDEYAGEEEAEIETVAGSNGYVDGVEVDVPISSPSSTLHAAKRVRRLKEPQQEASSYLEERKKLDLELMKEYHELKMKNEREFHAARMAYEREIHELNKKHLIEMHEKAMGK